MGAILVECLLEIDERRDKHEKELNDYEKMLSAFEKELKLVSDGLKINGYDA
jgi:hypothetical protein